MIWSNKIKNDFQHLLNTIDNLKMKMFISGSIPKAGHGDESYSRRLIIKKCIIIACCASSVTLIDNHNIFGSSIHSDRTESLFFIKLEVTFHC